MYYSINLQSDLHWTAMQLKAVSSLVQA